MYTSSTDESFDAAYLVGKLTLEQKVAQLRGRFATELVVPLPQGHAFDHACG